VQNGIKAQIEKAAASVMLAAAFWYSPQPIGCDCAEWRCAKA